AGLLDGLSKRARQILSTDLRIRKAVMGFVLVALILNLSAIGYHLRDFRSAPQKTEPGATTAPAVPEDLDEDLAPATTTASSPSVPEGVGGRNDPRIGGAD
ncbi:MAG: hypothetical protein RJP95_02360, partial [Pirellulales bacterium]